MRRALLPLSLLFAVAAVLTSALAADVSKGALNATTPGGVSPKPMAIERQREYALQCDSATCYKASASLQADGGLVTDCAADFAIAAGQTRDFESASSSYLSVNALEDGGVPGCRLFLKTKNK